MSLGDRFFKLLAIVLLGYAVIGKGFAYFGYPPLYIGEITMCFGLVALLDCENWSRVVRTAWFWPLYVFMVWGACRTIPYIGEYGAEYWRINTDALRDAAIWIWGIFAIVIASLLAAEPTRLRVVEGMFRKFVIIFIIVQPITAILQMMMGDSMFKAPWADVPMILVKGGDVDVHMAAIFAFAVLIGGFNTWFIVLGTVLNVGLTFTGRAAMVTFGLGAAVVSILRPKSPIVRRIYPTILAGFALFWLTDIRIRDGEGKLSRDISASQIIQNIGSIFSDSDNENLAGSKEWRIKWWDRIIDYTIHGKYFWTGKGFGVNLANDDEYFKGELQVLNDASLRSPHNGHMGILARTGVPGLTIWIIVQLTFAGGMIASAISAHRGGEKRWTALFIILVVYWAAFMTNAAFDVYLESPMGGIWMWCVYGVGMGSIWIYRNDPRAFDEEEQGASLPPIGKARRIIRLAPRAAVPVGDVAESVHGDAFSAKE